MKMTGIGAGALSVLLLLGGGILSCKPQDLSRKVSLEKREDSSATSEKQPHPIRIAVGGMITPREGYAYYREFLKYIEEKIEWKVEYVDREDYEEINNLLENGDVDLAFVCGGPYVQGHRKFGMQLLVAPQAYGGTVYYSYIIVRKDSPIQDLKGLRGKRFAFTDPLSNTGKLVPTYLLAKMGETPESFFQQHIYTKNHDRAIKAVADGVVDGAAVDSLIWEYSDRINPRYTSRTKIIQRSAPYGIPPVVVSKHLDRETKKKLKMIFLTAHEDARGKAILEKMMIDRFVVIQDSAYDSIRRMNEWIENRKKRE